MNPRHLASVAGLLSIALLGGCAAFSQRPPGGLEGRTLDTPRQAFEYFRDAARLKRYDLEYSVYSPEFIEDHGGFSLQDYIRGRPWASGEEAELLDNLLEATIGEPEWSADGRRARLVLTSDDFVGEVFLVRQTLFRIGIEGYPAPLEGRLDDLGNLVSVEGHEVRLRLPLTPGDLITIGAMPDPAKITRVEVSYRWYLRAVGKVDRRDP